MAKPLPKHRAREYETIFILNPEITTGGIEQIASRMTDVISRLDGKLLHAENWGKRRLAYPVRKHPKGYYVYLKYLGYSGMVHELERTMRMLEPVLKYLTVKLEEDVDPTARPVLEEGISFLPQIEEVPERPRTKKPTSSAEPEETAEAAQEEPGEVKKEEQAESSTKPTETQEKPTESVPAEAKEEPAESSAEPAPAVAEEEPAESSAEPAPAVAEEEPAADTEAKAEADSAEKAEE
jgi:small subunit ribosomal protein S6